MFEFTEDYRTGIPTIDEEHEYLFKLLNEAAAALDAGQTDLLELAGNFVTNLTDYAITHFAHEEAYMMEHNDPELPRQQKEHIAFEKKLRAFTIDNNISIDEIEELIHFIVRWLFGHILSSDMMIGKRAAEEKSWKDPFAFTEEYFTHIDFIDAEHESLFAIIRETNDLITAEYLHDKYDEILKILNKLRDYTEKHFQHEEEYMESISYPKLGMQKIAHAAFIEKLVDIDFSEMDKIDDNQQQYLIELTDYLLDWLSNHILKADKLIAEWVKEHHIND